MGLRVYNTLSRQKEPFTPVNDGKVGMYLCGPTVYKPSHIGHMVGPVIFDAIKRYLVHKDFVVTWIVNITDVDDKLIDAAAKQNTTVAALAEKYTAEYLDCLKRFGIEEGPAGINKFPKASEHIGEIIEMSKTLVDSGHAYAAGGNVWFDVTGDADYGKLSHRKVEEQESGLRELEGQGKRHPADFALWKAAKPGEPAWDSPWGSGRPGWHIECSAMSVKYLGETFDIHGGGMDLMFPHHENELAQTESATGRQFARYWLHNGLTRMRTKLPSGQWADEKMSGSIGNVISARQLLDTWGAEFLRYMLLSTHYRSPIDFSEEILFASRKAHSSFVRLFEIIEHSLQRRMSGQDPEVGPFIDISSPLPRIPAEIKLHKEILALQERFFEAMDDDFNTASAIAVMHGMARAINSFMGQTSASVDFAARAAQTLKKLGQILGLFQPGFDRPVNASTDGLTDPLMQLLIKLRNDARKAKNFALSDSVRDGLKELGITLEDRADGTHWRKE